MIVEGLIKTMENVLMILKVPYLQKITSKYSHKVLFAGDNEHILLVEGGIRNLEGLEKDDFYIVSIQNDGSWNEAGSNDLRNKYDVDIYANTGLQLKYQDYLEIKEDEEYIELMNRLSVYTNDFEDYSDDEYFAISITFYHIFENYFENITSIFQKISKFLETKKIPYFISYFEDGRALAVSDSATNDEDNALPCIQNLSCVEASAYIFIEKLPNNLSLTINSSEPLVDGYSISFVEPIVV